MLGYRALLHDRFKLAIGGEIQETKAVECNDEIPRNRIIRHGEGWIKSKL